SPQHLYGRVQDYTGQLAYKQQPWGVGMKFGLLAPDLYTDSQFITTAVARQAVEPQVTTPAGTFSYYALERCDTGRRRRKRFQPGDSRGWLPSSSTKQVG